MKLRKAELWAIVITAAFLALAAGWQLGTRHRAPAFSVTTEAALPARQAAAAVETESEPETEKVNINTADAETLKTLSGVGDALAERIIAYRDAHGPFERAEDIMLVSGIGQKTYEANLERITVETEDGT